MIGLHFELTAACAGGGYAPSGRWVSGHPETLPSARMGVQAERGFAGTRLQDRFGDPKLGGSLLERAGGEALRAGRRKLPEGRLGRSRLAS